MQNLTQQINDFSRKRLLRIFSPLFIAVFVWEEITAVPLFLIFLIIISIITYFHPYLMDFEREKIRYSRYLRDEEGYIKEKIAKYVATLEKYLTSQPLDFTSYREEYIRRKRWLESFIENTKYIDRAYEEFVQYYEYKLENLYFQGLCEKEEKIRLLSQKLEFLKNRLRSTQKNLEAIKPPID